MNPGPNDWFHIPVWASGDNIYDGDRQVLLELKTMDVVRSQPGVWAGYQLDTATVTYFLLRFILTKLHTCTHYVYILCRTFDANFIIFSMSVTRCMWRGPRSRGF